MKKNAKSEGRSKAAQGQLMAARCRAGPRSTVGHGDRSRDWRAWRKNWKRSGWRCADERYEHLADRQALRAGHVPSSLVMGGRRVKVSGRGRAVLRVMN